MKDQEKRALKLLLDVAGLSTLWAYRSPLNPSQKEMNMVQSQAMIPIARQWDNLEKQAMQCRACSLCETRQNVVFGAGDRSADWLIVGEAPGENEDIQGQPFVGQAGMLLDQMLKSLGLTRAKGLYIANTLKCRPPQNRDPLPEEMASCSHFLQSQIALIKPKIILAVGKLAMRALLGQDQALAKVRGIVHRYNGIPVVITYHPAYLLRSPSQKQKAWEDLVFARRVSLEKAYEMS